MLAEIPLSIFLRERIAVLGAGSIGEQVVEALYEKGHQNIIATRRSKDALEVLAQKYERIEITTDNRYAAQQAHTIILAVKPKIIEEVAQEIRGYTSGKLVISIAAAKSLDVLYRVLDKQARVARVMTGLYVKYEIAAYCLGRGATQEDKERVRYIFGQTAREMEEKFLAHRTFVACDTGLMAKEIEEKMKQLEKEGLSRENAYLFYAAMLEAVAQKLRKGVSGEEIYGEVGGEGSFTKSLGSSIEERGYYRHLQECVEKTVAACGGK